MSKKKEAANLLQGSTRLIVNESFITTLEQFKGAVKAAKEEGFGVLFVKPYPAEVNLIARECVKLGCRVAQSETLPQVA